MRGRDASVVRLEDLGFAAKNEHDGTPRVTDVERFIVLVEYQDGLVHARTAHDDAKIGRPRTRQP
jgi:hypothetical protein